MKTEGLALWSRISLVTIENLQLRIYMRAGHVIACTFVRQAELSDCLKSLTSVPLTTPFRFSWEHAEALARP
ncbi:MAG TPA: hypothetical protein VGR78_04440 [Verrucomicrobiae bacterium]|nr:hypothetical protein [Verrucomicrobiae bacterium]